jgi:serine/threonine protein kinase
LRPDGDVRIGDLGLAIQPLSAPQASEALDAKAIAASEHTSAVGTFLYMAPEQLLGASKGVPRLQYDEKVDIYSLGIILFELV